MRPTLRIDLTLSSANLQSTVILDSDHEEIRALARTFADPTLTVQRRLQHVHHHLVQVLNPVYSLNEWQPASVTLLNRRGSCSQRMACLEAIARALGIPTRVHVLYVARNFWYPRFGRWRIFMPKRILLLWPQFQIGEQWVDFDELHAPVTRLVEHSPNGFTNDGESLFEAVLHTPVDFFAKTAALSCATPSCNLSRFVVGDEGFFDLRDEAIQRFGTLNQTLRGRLFEILLGERPSTSRAQC